LSLLVLGALGFSGVSRDLGGSWRFFVVLTLILSMAPVMGKCWTPKCLYGVKKINFKNYYTLSLTFSKTTLKAYNKK
jgi:hypothetical protein